MSLWARFERWLGSPRLSWRAAAVGVGLSLPALGVGFVADDHFLRATSLGLNPPELSLATKWDLFRFYSGDPALFARWLELGIAPWWAPPDLKVAFWRPVASALHQLDFTLWPHSPALMHAHSLAWLGALVLAAGAMFHRLHAVAWVAALATLLFAVDDGHGLPTGWIANRNALIATCFAALTLWAHDRWRRDGWRPGALLSLGTLGAGLLSGELALGALGGVLAHAWVFEKGTRARLGAALPALVLVAAWRVAHALLGYGAHGSGLYVDPLHSPVAFAVAVVERLPLLLFAQLGGLSSDLWAFVARPVGLALALLSALGCLVLGRGLFQLVRRDEVARFHALWLVLAVLPGCATFPNDRLLMVASLAGAGLVAQALAAWRAGGPISRRMALFLVAVHLIVAPLSLPARAGSMRVFAAASERSFGAVPHDLPGKTLIVVNAPDGLMCAQILAHGASLGIGLPARLRCLGVSRSPLVVSRTSERTLVLEARDGFFDGALDTLFRAPEIPWRVGEGPRLGAVTVTVGELTPAGRPKVLRAELDAPLESESHVFITWRGSRYVRFTPPGVGERVDLPAISMSDVLFGR